MGLQFCELKATKLFTKPTGETGQGLVAKAPRPMNAQLFTTFGKFFTKKSFTSKSLYNQKPLSGSYKRFFFYQLKLP